MYNINHPASRFRIGYRVKTSPTCGLDSNKTATVCQHFTPKDGYVAYLKQKGWVPVEFDNGIQDYMPKNYLKLI